MIFIKNLTKLNGSEIEIGLTENGDGVSISLTIAKETSITLAKTTTEGVASTLRRSVERIGKLVDVLKVDGETTSTCLLDNKPTELNFVVKNSKVVIKKSDEFPVTIGKYEEEDEKNNVHYPRDLIVFIVNKTVDGVDKDYRLVVDRRNLGAPIFTTDIGDFRIIAMPVKYPMWSRLKFPAYAYIKGNDDEVLTEIKLGFKQDRKITKNQVLEVEPNEAVDYLTETFRIMREKYNDGVKTRHYTNGGYNDNRHSQRNGNNNRPNNGRGRKNFSSNNEGNKTRR